MCERERERVCVCMYVCVRESEREMVWMLVCVRARDSNGRGVCNGAAAVSIPAPLEGYHLKLLVKGFSHSQFTHTPVNLILQHGIVKLS